LADRVALLKERSLAEATCATVKHSIEIGGRYVLQEVTAPSAAKIYRGVKR